MKITGFRPLIVTSKSEDTIALFEALGFERRHKKTGINGDVDAVVMKDENGFRLNIVQADQMPQDLTSIAMNVDNFEEAYEFLISKGFMCHSGGVAVETATNKSCCMIAPSGFAFVLCQHLKD